MVRRELTQAGAGPATVGGSGPVRGPRVLPSGLVMGATVFLAVGIVGLLTGGALLDYGNHATVAIVDLDPLQGQRMRDAEHRVPS